MPEHIKNGVSLFGVEGTYEGESSGTYTLVNGSSTAVIEFCGNALDPGQSVTTPVPPYSTYTYMYNGNAYPMPITPRVTIMIPSGSVMASTVSAVLQLAGGSTQNVSIASTKFSNLGTVSSTGYTYYVLGTTNTQYLQLMPNANDVLTITAN